MSICIHVKYPLFLSDFSETLIFWTDFSENYSNTKFHEDPSSGSPVAPCGQTDGQTYDEADSRFSQFCERT